MRIRGDSLSDDEKWCPGDCGNRIHRDRRHCGRRWYVVRILGGVVPIDTRLYGSSGLKSALPAEPWWWDTSKCSHPPGVACSGPLGCRVLDSVAEDQRRLWSARRHETLNAARTAAIRQLRREGWDNERMPTLLLWVMEDQSHGVPHLHFVLGHTTALEKAFARTFFRELKSAAYAHGLGHTTTYEMAVLEQGNYEAGRLRNYVRSSASTCRRATVRRRFFYVTRASVSSTSRRGSVRLSGMTMTIARLSRRVWAARKGLIDMPSMTSEQQELVSLLLDPVVCAPHAPERPPASGRNRVPHARVAVGQAERSVESRRRAEGRVVELPTASSSSAESGSVFTTRTS